MASTGTLRARRGIGEVQQQQRSVTPGERLKVISLVKIHNVAL